MDAGTFGRIPCIGWCYYRTARWGGGLNLTILGSIAVCGVGRESYGFGRCSVLAITGVFKFLLPQIGPSLW
jgi:hypothetical protein